MDTSIEEQEKQGGLVGTLVCTNSAESLESAKNRLEESKGSHLNSSCPKPCSNKDFKREAGTAVTQV